MSVEVNLIFINGWGGDPTSFSSAGLRNRILAKFGRTIYCPPPVNYKETGLILRYLDEWKDPTILVGLSCGCSTINEVLRHAPAREKVPFAIYYSPSQYCGIGKVPSVVDRALEVNSNYFDFFNLGMQRMLYPAAGNTRTEFMPQLKTGLGHGFTPGSAQAQAILISEIEKVQKP